MRISGLNFSTTFYIITFRKLSTFLDKGIHFGKHIFNGCL